MKLDFPDLKRAVVEQAHLWRAKTIVIEDKASGTQLIQELSRDGLRGVQRYDPEIKEKSMRMHAQTNIIENGFVYLPEQAEWLAAYIHELKTFPNGKYDDQADSTSQALDWCQLRYHGASMGIYWWMKEQYDEAIKRGEIVPNPQPEEEDEDDD